MQQHPDIVVVVVASTGRYFSSGHDLKAFTAQVTKLQSEGADLEAFLKLSTKENAFKLVHDLIEFKKPIIACVNGPAVGFAVTTLALCDIVYCNNQATFNVPFMQLGFCAEGCSSLLFPQIMGPSKANEMLLLGKKMTAVEAERCGFVAQVFSEETLEEQVLARAKQMSNYPPNALIQTKDLVQQQRRAALHHANEIEIQLLIQRFLSDECAQAVMGFLMQQQAAKSEKNNKNKNQKKDENLVVTQSKL